MYIEYDHPGNAEQVMRIYRKHILSAKRKFGNARALIQYQGYVDTYLAAKRKVLKERANEA